VYRVVLQCVLQRVLQCVLQGVARGDESAGRAKVFRVYYYCNRCRGE